MINVSSAWNRAIFNDKRDYLEYVDITLANGTVLNLTNANIWEGGFSIEDAVSSDSDLQLGTAIINKFTLCINNMYDDFSGYVFEDARLSVRIGLVTDTSTEVIQKGRYIVENASYNGDLITLECYDYMRFFDVPYSNSNQVYPAALDNIVRNACTDIGITLNTPNFPHKTFVVQNRPEDEATTYREVIAWAAQVAGCYARMNPNGQLELKWYDQAALSQALEGGLDGGIFDTSTPYSTGDQADGGSFNPWNTGYVYDSGVFSNASNVHMISSLYSEDISVDDVVITGVRILVKTQNDEQNGEVIKTFQQGSNGYVIEISENPMITVSDANTVLQWLATQLIGFTFRKANISHGSNPAIEAGDVAIIFDRKGGIYPIIVSKTSFSVGSSQTTVSAAQTPSRNSAARFSAETKNYVELRKRLKNERTTREQIEAQLAQQIEESNGLYETDEVQADQSVKHYLHNKPNLEDSDIQILVSSVGITVTANGTDPNPTWYGLTVNGDLIARILTATGVNADWINAGQLVIRDQNGNETFFADTTTGVVRINASSFSLTGTTIDSIAQSKANAALASANSYTDSSTASAKSYSDNQLADYKDVVDGLIEDLQDQIDGQFETYYYDYEPTLNNYPANQWTTDAIKKEHEGDMFLWKSTGYAYRFFNMGTEQSPVWKWQAIQDSGVATALATAEDALALAGVKRRIFTEQPTPPYDQKDLWVQGSNGDIMVCATSRATGSYVASDWERASKYTDDSALNTFVNGSYATTMQNIQGQIDGKVDTWYQSSDPSVSWNTAALKNQHIGDIWYNSTSADQKSYRWSGIAWQEMTSNPPQAVFNQISGKAQIFVAQPTTPYSVGDLWVQGSTGDILRCTTARATGNYNGSDWTLASKYTDDSALTTWINGTFSDTINDLKAQDDLKAETWYQSNDPSGAWNTSELKTKHKGDLWYNTSSQKYFRWDGSTWNELTATPPDSVFDRIDGKAQIFVSQPVPPYSIGDLWVQGSNGDILKCTVSKTTAQSFDQTDWVLASKYTDDSSLNLYRTVVTERFNNLEDRMDGIAEQWFIEGEPTDSNYPANQWTTDEEKNNHIDDLCYDKVSGKVYLYGIKQSNGIKIKFSSSSRTESVTYDYVQIFYEYNGKIYSMPKLGGTTIANSEQIIPTTTFYLYWKTDNSNESYYGYSIDSVVASDAGNTGTEASLPTGVTAQTLATGVFPESVHGSYGNNVKELYLCDSGISTSTVYGWTEIQDEDIATALADASQAKDTADQKRRVFITQPVAPYDEGDLWSQGSSGDILVCKSGIHRAEGYGYDASDWLIASKYTDDSALESFISGDFADTIDSVRGQIDSKAETWYQSTDPSTSWSSAEKPRHEGDLWYKTTDNSTWRYDGSEWVEQLVPTEVFDKIDTKKQIFVTATRPTPPYDEGDLWAQGSTGDIYYCKQGIHKVSGDQYDPNDWAKGSKYTDDTTVKTQYGTCATAAGTAAKVVTLTGFKIYNGARISVKFTYANTVGSPTLNVNSTGAKSIRAYGSALTATSPYNWSANSIVDFVYDGTYWNISDSGSLAKAKAVIEQMTQEGIFNLLTNNGTIQGIFMQDGQLFINASYIQSGTLKLGGANNENGTLELYNSKKVRIGLWNNNGFFFGNISGTSASPTSPKTKIDTNGAITAKSFTADDYIKVDGGSGSYLKIPLHATKTDQYIEARNTGLTIVNESNTVRFPTNDANYKGLYMNETNSTSVFADALAIKPRIIRIFKQGGGSWLDLCGDEIDLCYNSGTTNYKLIEALTSRRSVYITGSFYVYGSKSRTVKTNDYADRNLYCYETPTPTFGDIGEGVIGTDGKCYVTIDPIFVETVSLKQYQVFLQKYGIGECYVSERKPSYFVVEGNPGISFGWEIKAKQDGYDQIRLDKHEETVTPENTLDYADEAIKHINQLTKERGITE